MNRLPSSYQLLVVVMGAFALVLPQRASAQPLDNPNWKELREYVNYPKYKTSSEWTTLKKVLTGSDSLTLKRLGLPVHGHWVLTYVNKPAAAYIEKYTNATDRPNPLDFPVGSCIIKENYRPRTDVNAFEPMSDPTVLTVMYKNDGNFHQTSQTSYNGEDGYLGGNWFYAFFFLPNKNWRNAMNPLETDVQHNVSSFCITCHSPAFNTDYLRSVNNAFNPFSQPPTKSYCEQVLQKLPPNPGLPPAEIPSNDRAIGRELDNYCEPKLSNELPSDVPFDPSVVFELYGSKVTQTMFDCYAWKTFVALNWPAQPGERGVPVANNPINFVRPRTGPTVWETYKPTYGIFQPDNPHWDPTDQPWNQPNPAIHCSNDVNTEGKLAITMVSKVRDVVNETGQAFAGTFGFLVDQNGNKVHYEVLVNKTEFKYLVKDGKATTKNLTPVGPSRGGQVLPITFPDGSIEVKSAWKVLAIGTDHPHPDAATWAEAQKKFYARELHVYDSEHKTCNKVRLGLVGLHIAHKTHYAPQWIWMTFEHKDNVPPYGEKKQASFFSPTLKYKNQDFPVDFVPPQPVPKDCFNKPFLWFNTDDVLKCPNVDLNRFTFGDVPNQVTRLDPVGKAAQEINASFQKLMEKLGGTPFENYRLINTQWPLHGLTFEGEVAELNCADNGIDKSAKCFTMIPPHLRNTSMESFMSTYCKTPDGKVGQFSNRSCMGCHGNAGSDFSYVYLDAVTQRVKLKQKQ